MIRSQIVSLLVVAWLALLSGCGEPRPDVAPQRYERVDLDVVPGAPPFGAETVVQRFELSTDASRWDVVSPASSVEPLPGGDAPTLRLTAAPDEGRITIARAGEFDLPRINAVRITYTFSGISWAAARFSTDGETVHESPALFLQRTEAPESIVLPLELGGTTGTCDRLELVFGSKAHRVVHVLRVETLNLPLGGELPPASGPPTAYALPSASRLAQRLVTDRPLEAALDVGRDAELRFAVARNVAPPEEPDASLLVTLIDEDGEQVAAKRFAAPYRTKTWTPGTLDLDDHAGELLTVRFTLEGPPEAWLLGEVALWGRPDASRPSVVLITSDTHRADHVGVAPDAVDVRTPAIDALAREGVLFLDATSPTNVTNPSHIAMMTGIDPRDTGIVVNRVPLAERATTIAEVFADAGYVTHAAVGTAHIGHAGSGLGQGFDRMDWPRYAPRDARAVVDVAEEWLALLRGQSVFLWVHVFDAHWPYEPPDGFDRMYYDGDADPFDPSRPPLAVPDDKLPVDMRGLRDLAYPRAQYRAEVTSLDAQLGRLLDMPPLRDAVVALTSDHGEGLGESLVWFEHAELYPGSLRVPLMLRWPGGPRDVRVAEPVSNIDVGHTLAALAGLDAPDFPGRDLSALVGRDETSRPLRFVLSSSAHSASLQDGDDYLILHLIAHESPTSQRAFGRHQVELYDLATDPACRVDLVTVRTERAREMRARLVAWLQDAAPSDLRGAANESPELLEQLQALGYVDQSVAPASSYWQDDRCAWCRRLAR